MILIILTILLLHLNYKYGPMNIYIDILIDIIIIVGVTFKTNLRPVT